VAGIGGRLDAPPSEAVAVRLRVEGAAGGLARLRGGAGTVLEARLAGDDETVAWTTTAAATPWVRAEVRRDGAMVALTNPVLLGPAGASGRPPA
jgi:hypothetical protein